MSGVLLTRIAEEETRQEDRSLILMCNETYVIQKICLAQESFSCPQYNFTQLSHKYVRIYFIIAL